MKNKITEYAQMILAVMILTSLCFSLGFYRYYYRYYYKLVLEPFVIETIKETK